MLPKEIHQRLANEFKMAAANVAKAETIEGKAYYFSIFWGEAGRQLNIHWDPDIALLFHVGQFASQALGTRPPVPVDVGFLPNGLPEGFLQALDQVSAELAGSFEGEGVDLPRFYTALARIAELTYITTGNGAYLYQKGMIKL